MAQEKKPLKYQDKNEAFRNHKPISIAIDVINNLILISFKHFLKSLKVIYNYIVYYF